MNVFELFGTIGLKGTEKVNQDLTTVEKRAQKVQKGLKVMGLAFTAVGAAGLAMIQSTKKINASLGVTAMTLGATTKEMRDLTLATTNVTFPIDEVTQTFDLLARAGVKDKEVLKAVATSFDTLGDAIGKPASEVTAKLIPAMKTFNLSATQMAGKTDNLTHLFRNTTVTLDDFNKMVGYVTPDLVEMGLTTDDMVAILAELENQGYSGITMTREFQKAVNLARKEQIPLNEALGISGETIANYKTELEGAVGETQKYADVANEQFTIMDNLKQKFGELTLRTSEYLEPMEPLLAGMTAMGPLMMGLSSSAGTAAIKWGLHTAALIAHKAAMVASAIAIKAVTTIQWLWNAALTANPIGLIIAAIVALVAAGIFLWKNWEKVVLFFVGMWATIKDTFFSNINAIIGQVNRLIAIINKIPGVKIGKVGSVGGVKKFAQGGMITEPTLLSSLKTGRPYGIAGEDGNERIVPGAGGATITNNFSIAQLIVREEADVPRIARELFVLQQQRVRGAGG